MIVLLSAPDIAGAGDTTSLRRIRQPVSFSAIGLGDGLPNGTVNAIVRDRTGYMWFATLDGLCRYDGYEIEVFTHDPADSTSVADNAVAIGALLVDRSGRLWIGTYAGGLDRFDPETGHFIHYRHDPRNPASLGSNSVRAVFEDRTGALWVGTLDAGVDRMTDMNGTFEHFRHDSSGSNSLSDNSVTCICEDSAGALWIGTRGGGVNCMDRDRRRIVAYVNEPGNPASLTQGEVWSVCADADSSVWIGTVNGLNRWERSTGTFTRFTHHQGIPGSLTHEFVISLSLDPRRDLWVGTFGGGLDCYKRESRTFEHYHHDPAVPSGLQSNLIRTVYIDPASSGQGPFLWVGLEGAGVARSNTAGKAFRSCRSDPENRRSLPAGAVNAVCEDRRGVIWIGTMNGLARFDSVAGGNACFTRVAAPPAPGGVNNDQITSLAEDPSGHLWIGTYKGGLLCLDSLRRSFRQFRARSGIDGSISSNTVNAVLEDHEGRLWIGTQSGLDFFDAKRTRFTHFRHTPGDPRSLTMDRVRALLETRDGILWIGTESGGLNMYDRTSRTFTAYRYDPRDSTSLSNDRVYSLFEDGGNTLWVGTSNGLNRMDRTSGSFARFGSREGLTASYVRGIAGDEDGNLWLNTTRGLTLFRTTPLTVHTYDVSDGLVGNDLSGASYRTRGGEIIIGGDDGFTAFVPREIIADPRTPQVVLTSFSIFDRPAPLGRPVSAMETIRLAYSENFFSFGFASLDYTNPGKQVYDFILEGFDRDWVHAGTRRFAYYTNVAPGHYTFRVKGANADGIWGDRVTSVRVIVDPPFWQTWWFIILAALSLAGAVAALYNYRVSKLLEMERMRVRISSDLHDDIGSNLSSIALIADMVHNALPADAGERPRLQDVARTARHTADALKDIVWIISPSHERLDDIVLRMKDAAARLLTGIDYTFDSPRDGLSERLTMEFRRNVLLMYKEVLNNIAKYARATRVSIAVRESHQMFHMSITDNGIGYDENRIVPGNGLRNLRQRAAALGGNVLVKSAPGEGTVVDFEVNISNNPHPSTKQRSP